MFFFIASPRWFYCTAYCSLGRWWNALQEICLEVWTSDSNGKNLIRMVSKNDIQFGAFHRLHMFVGSTLASTCPATFVFFAVDVSCFFFHGRLSSYIFLLSSISTLGWCVIFFVALLGSFLHWHPWKAPFFRLNFDCVVSLSMSLEFGLCFVFMPMLCVCGSSSSFLFLCCCCCCCGSAAAVSDGVGVAFLLLHQNCHPK